MRYFSYSLPLLLIPIWFGFTNSNYQEISEERGKEAYQQLVSVLTHPRCTNCHPSDGIPKQGDNSTPHQFDLKRAVSEKGYASLQCSTCHQEENNLFSGVPGAPHWQLAPESMAWEGLSGEEIVSKMLNPTQNGNRTNEDLIHHLTEDELVLWAWNPGIDQDGVERSTPPIDKKTYIKAVKDWFAAGTPTPRTAY